MFNRREMLQACGIGATGLLLPNIAQANPIEDVISTGFPTIDQNLGGGLRTGTFVLFKQYVSDTQNLKYCNQHRDPTSYHIISNILNNYPDRVFSEGFRFTDNKKEDNVNLQTRLREAIEENKILFGIKEITESESKLGFHDFLASTIFSVTPNVYNHFYISVMKNRWGKVCTSAGRHSYCHVQERVFLAVNENKKKGHDTLYISSVGEAFDKLIKSFPNADNLSIHSCLPDYGCFKNTHATKVSFGWNKINGQWNEI